MLYFLLMLYAGVENRDWVEGLCWVYIAIITKARTVVRPSAQAGYVAGSL
jgi:hypothetical protein